MDVEDTGLGRRRNESSDSPAQANYSALVPPDAAAVDAAAAALDRRLRNVVASIMWVVDQPTTINVIIDDHLSLPNKEADAAVAALVTAALSAAEAPPLTVPSSEAIDCLSLQELSPGSRVYTVNDSPALYSEAMLRECYVTRGRTVCAHTNEPVVAVRAHTLHPQAS